MRANLTFISLGRGGGFDARELDIYIYMIYVYIGEEGLMRVNSIYMYIYIDICIYIHIICIHIYR